MVACPSLLPLGNNTPLFWRNSKDTVGSGFVVVHFALSWTRVFGNMGIRTKGRGFPLFVGITVKASLRYGCLVLSPVEGARLW